MTNNIDFMDFQEELLTNTREAIDLSKEYLKSRVEYSKFFNKLIILLNKTGLDKSKKSVDNKIVELMSDKIYGEVAQQYHAKMLEEEATYKGLELVVKSYHNHCSGLQSVMKMQTQGEISESMRQKYGK